MLDEIIAITLTLAAIIYLIKKNMEIGISFQQVIYMALLWRKQVENLNDVSKGLFENSTTSKQLEIDLSEPVRKYVIKAEKWCEAENPETCQMRDLSKIETYKCYNLILSTIYQNFKEKEFTIKSLLDLVDIEGISDGGRQRKILNQLVCKGILSKELITHNVYGNELKKKFYKFKLKYNITPCIYYQKKLYKNGKVGYSCLFDWKKDSELTYYWGDQKDS